LWLKKMRLAAVNHTEAASRPKEHRSEPAMRTCGRRWTGMRILDDGDHEDVGMPGELGGGVDDGHVQRRAGQNLQGTRGRT
jgi:hypothetical protein